MQVNEVGEGTKTYQIIENKNKELVDQVVNFQYKDLELKLTTTAKFKVIGSANNEQYEIVPVDASILYSKKLIDKELLEQKINQINTSFDILKEFKAQNGILCRKKPVELKIVDLLEVGGFGSDLSGVRPFGPFYDYSVSEFGIDLEYKFKSYYSMLSLYIDTDGSFKNRKYNLDLEDYENNCIPDISYVYNHFKDRLKQKLGDIVKVDDKNVIYTDKFCVIYSIEKDKISVQFIPVRKDKVSYQEHPGYDIYKLPKKLKEIRLADYINVIESNLVDETKDVFYKSFC